MGDHHMSTLAQARAAAAHWQQQAALGEQLVQEVAEGAQSVLAQHLEAREAARKEALRAQVDQVAKPFWEELTVERKERHAALTQVRFRGHPRLPACPRSGANRICCDGSAFTPRLTRVPAGTAALPPLSSPTS